MNNEDVLQRNDAGKLEIRTAPSTGDTGTNPDDVYTRDEQGRLCVRTTGGGGGGGGGTGTVTSVNGVQPVAGNVEITGDNITATVGEEEATITQHLTTLQQSINEKQDALTTEQLAAVNSGITSAKVVNYDAYADEISTAQSTADKADGAAEVAQQTANLAGQNAAQALEDLKSKANTTDLPQNQTGTAGQVYTKTESGAAWANIPNGQNIAFPHVLKYTRTNDDYYGWARFSANFGALADGEYDFYVKSNRYYGSEVPLFSFWTYKIHIVLQSGVVDMDKSYIRLDFNNMFSGAANPTLFTEDSYFSITKDDSTGEIWFSSFASPYNSINSDVPIYAQTGTEYTCFEISDLYLADGTTKTVTVSFGYDGQGTPSTPVGAIIGAVRTGVFVSLPIINNYQTASDYIQESASPDITQFSFVFTDMVWNNSESAASNLVNGFCPKEFIATIYSENGDEFIAKIHLLGNLITKEIIRATGAFADLKIHLSNQQMTLFFAKQDWSAIFTTTTNVGMRIIGFGTFINGIGSFQSSTSNPQPDDAYEIPDATPEIYGLKISDTFTQAVNNAETYNLIATVDLSTDVTLAANMDASNYSVADGALKLPTNAGYVDYGIEIRLSGSFAGGENTNREFSVQLQRADGTVVSEKSIVKISGNDLSKRGVVFETYTNTATDPFIASGLKLVINNTSGQTLNLTGCDILIKARA